MKSSPVKTLIRLAVAGIVCTQAAAIGYLLLKFVFVFGKESVPAVVHHWDSPDGKWTCELIALHSNRAVFQGMMHVRPYRNRGQSRGFSGPAYLEDFDSSVPDPKNIRVRWDLNGASMTGFGPSELFLPFLETKTGSN